MKSNYTHTSKSKSKGIKSLPLNSKYKDYTSLFDTYKSILERCYNLFIFIIDGLTYAYNFCTSYFYELKIVFLEDTEKYRIEKVYYIVKTLNYYRLHDVRFYDFIINPITGTLERCIQRRVCFLDL